MFCLIIMHHINAYLLWLPHETVKVIGLFLLLSEFGQYLIKPCSVFLDVIPFIHGNRIVMSGSYGPQTSQSL